MTVELTGLGAEQLARVVEISRNLNTTTDINELLTYIIKEAASLTGTEAASILLLDPHTSALNFMAASNDLSPEMAMTPVPLDSSIAGAVLKENRPLHITDVTADPRWNHNVDETIDFVTREILGVPMHNADHKPVGVLEAINKLEGQCTQQDVELLSILADIAGVAVEKLRLIQELSELDQLKTDFIAIASHELRTPLAIILGYAAFLREDAPDDRIGHLDSVLGAANRLNGLIQEMLNFQYSDANVESLTVKPVDFLALVKKAADNKRMTIEAKEHSLRLEMPQEEALMIPLDAVTIEVVIGNLLDNAARFTHDGGQITVSVVPGDDEVRLCVRDNGIGIPRDQLERIFRRFYQVEHHMSRRHGGLGLGLSIAKELVELHNGRIWVESELGKGSSFWIALPRQV